MEEKKKISATFTRIAEAGSRRESNVLARSGRQTHLLSRQARHFCVIKEPELCRLPGTPRARLRCSWCPRSKECMRPQPEHDRFVSTSRSTKQGHADCRAARAHKLPCHTVLRAFRSPAQRLRLRLKDEVDGDRDGVVDWLPCRQLCATAVRQLKESPPPQR